jgi:hypothetical protein
LTALVHAVICFRLLILTKVKNSKSQLLFSIAKPVFGQAHFLPAALLSVLAQTSRYQLAVMDATPDFSVQTALKDYSLQRPESARGLLPETAPSPDRPVSE